jgi:alkanesulfonate monooxygenase SsuD/methylene tetrahydromethanopterin reductase-like flavin-dependent oxidoreductase (luciferase family)
MMVGVHLDLLLDPFGARWTDVRRAAMDAERAGYDGIWLWDHLAGSVHRSPHVLECWTVLAALAEATQRVMLGPLVVNVANRDPAMLALMASTFQEVSGGRLLLGLGAGGGAGTPYVGEQLALGRTVPADAERRRQVEDAVTTMRAVWADAGRAGFLRPNPVPPIVIGGFGRKMAELAGRVGDGFNTQALAPDLHGMVQTARRATGPRKTPFLVTAFTGFDKGWRDPERPERRHLEALGVDRLILIARP